MKKSVLLENIGTARPNHITKTISFTRPLWIYGRKCPQKALTQEKHVDIMAHKFWKKTVLLENVGAVRLKDSTQTIYFTRPLWTYGRTCPQTALMQEKTAHDGPKDF